MTPLERAALAASQAAKLPQPADDDEFFMSIARAVLTAIREPSEGMERAYYGGEWGFCEVLPALDDLWPKMIDAALEEG